MAETVLATRDGAIATVTLNAPEKLNALDLATWTRLGEVIVALAADDSLRCIVLRGAGEKAFAAGADIGEFATVRKNARVSKLYGERVAATMQAVMDCRHPTVALIRGACVGGGLEVAACCDIRICGESSRFGVPIKRLGLVMAYGELAKLAALVGRAVALEILLEGRVFNAAEALAKGLVNRVVADAEVEKEAYACARRIAEGAPLVARWHKKFLNRLLDPRPLTEAEKDEGFTCYDTEDFKKGVEAFLAKRDPAFKGR
ncbi:MAG: enoyl-CoA hydratase/isomerase family protein [Rhodospirillales bacterium]|nr:enoyl-CoA hydratase/isomerase family protein [Rhodospirillales bacterium]MSP79681.1 enoyl-CoA hydratase/isomerase family protein [Rhodospirillales bacterium]